MPALSLLAFRSLASNRIRTAIVVAAVLLSMAAFNAVLLANDAMTRGLETAVQSTVGRAQLQVRAASTLGFPDATVDRIKALPGVSSAAAVARKRVFYRSAAGHGFVELVAVEPSVEARVRDYRLVDGEFIGDGRPDGVVVRDNWAAEHGLKAGDAIELITQGGLSTFSIVGLLAPDDAGVAAYGDVVLITLGTARAQFGLQDRVGALALVLASDEDIPSVREALSRNVSEAHVVRAAPDVRADLSRSVTELQALLLLFGVTALFVAVFLIFNTMEMTVVDEARAIGQLRAAGATRPQITSYFLQQALIPGFVGAVGGTVVGYGLAQLLAAAITRAQGVTLAPPEFSPLIFLTTIGLGLVIVGLAGLSPAMRASRLIVVDLLHTSVSQESRIKWRFVGLGMALAISSLTGMLLVGSSHQLVRAILLFPFLTGLVLASRAAVVPLGLLLGAPFNRLGTGAPRLAARNVLRQVGRTSLTVAGFMVSLALLVGIASVATSTLQAGERWTQSLLPSEYVVVSPVEQPAVFVEQFTSLPDVAYASPVGFFTARSDETIFQIATIVPAVFGPGLDVEGDREAAIAAFNRGGAVLVPRRLANARGLRDGDMVPLMTAQGTRAFKIAGIVARSFPSVDGNSTVLMNRADAVQWFGEDGFRLLMVEPAGSRREVATGVAELAARYGMSATSSDSIAAEVASAIGRILALLGALVGIGLLIGGFGTANTMLMNLAERRQELDVLWAVGMSRTQLRVMAVVEAGMMGLMGGLLGGIIGGVLAWLLVSFSRTPGFQPEFVYSWPAALVGVALAVVAACFAATVPAGRIISRVGR